MKAKDETTLMFTMRPSLACYHGGRVVFVAFAFEPLATMPPPLVAARVPRAIVDAPKVPARRGRPPGSTKKKKEAALAAQAALAAAGGLRAPGRVNPELVRNLCGNQPERHRATQEWRRPRVDGVEPPHPHRADSVTGIVASMAWGVRK